MILINHKFKYKDIKYLIWYGSKNNSLIIFINNRLVNVYSFKITR